MQNFNSSVDVGPGATDKVLSSLLITQPGSCNRPPYSEAQPTSLNSGKGNVATLLQTDVRPASL